jgi:hypothetical protein
MVLLLNWSLAACASPVSSIQVPYARHAPGIKAAVDDFSWNEASKISGLTLSEEASYVPKAIPPTTVLLQWDRDYLYVRFICEGDGEPIYSPYSGRDAPYFKGDVAEVFLDPKGDGRETVEIEVSPNNGVLDQISICTAEPKCDAGGVLEKEIIDRDFWSFPSWNLNGLRTAASKNEKNGWIVDMAIPVSILRRTGSKEFGPMVLRANFIRYDYPLKEKGGKARNTMSLNWSPVRQGCPHISPVRMGWLQLIEH